MMVHLPYTPLTHRAVVRPFRLDGAALRTFEYHLPFSEAHLLDDFCCGISLWHGALEKGTHIRNVGWFLYLPNLKNDKESKKKNKLKPIS